MEKRERKIMVAIDESEESMYALSWSISNLIADTNNNNKLVLLYVKPPSAVYSLDSAGYIFSNDTIDTLENYSSQLAKSVMKRAEAIYRNFDDTDINIEKVVGTGDAKNVICNAAKKLGADTLVMGSHGYGFIKRALLGSVSDYCVKNAKCPVVIVKQP
ncbi:putative universal stress protein A [Medicago truncatula]|uniref:Putative universal stress protein A n=2 Tax=Trifolieae TaxID=163742 RepID=G7IDR7_MEDTR|nr:universal stress protein PHOS32 [Medicago truncatula]AES61668.1 universal stress family protein [Medicago truncatula]RHN81045.1 putative universal stress protein A [Medicago truncatula]